MKIWKNFSAGVNLAFLTIHLFDKYKDKEHRLIGAAINAGTAISGGALYKVLLDSNNIFFITALAIFAANYGFWYLTEWMNYASMEMDELFDEWDGYREDYEKSNQVDAWNKEYNSRYIEIKNFSKSLNWIASFNRHTTFVLCVLGSIITTIGMVINFALIPKDALFPILEHFINSNFKIIGGLVLVGLVYLLLIFNYVGASLKVKKIGKTFSKPVTKEKLNG